MNESPVVDWPQLLEMRELQEPGEPDVVRDLIETFIADSTVRMARLEAALRAADLPTVQLEAHTLKGSAGLMFAEPLRHVAGEVEAMARQGGAGTLASTVDRLTAALTTVQRFLTAQLDPV